MIEVSGTVTPTNDRHARRPYRVVFEDLVHNGVIRRSTIVALNKEHARREAQSIARSGRKREIHYIANDSASTELEVHEP